MKNPKKTEAQRALEMLEADPTCFQDKYVAVLEKCPPDITMSQIRREIRKRKMGAMGSGNG